MSLDTLTRLEEALGISLILDSYTVYHSAVDEDSVSSMVAEESPA